MQRSLRLVTLNTMALCALVGSASSSTLPTQSGDDDVVARQEGESLEIVDAMPAAILGLATEAAARMPLHPHVKTRSRLQFEIVEAAVEAGEFEAAAAVIPQIRNWRQGLAQAAIAAGLAERGLADRARKELEAAEAMELTLTDEFVQGWRRDRVRARIATAYAHLGDLEKAAEIQMRLTGSEAGRLATLSARMADPAKIDANTKAFVAICQTGELEQIQSALMGIVEFYGMLEKDEERRAVLERTIRENWTRIPGEPRIQILEALVEMDAAAGRLEHGILLVNEIEAMVRDNRWNPERAIALLAGVGRARQKVGQNEECLKVLREAMRQYEAKREGIVNIWRGRSLRPLAEAFVAAGSPASAAEIYERALVEAVENPNSRPRLEDLVRTCNSIVSSGLEAPESLRRALMRTGEALGSPW